jgi:hypothetical protein
MKSFLLMLLIGASYNSNLNNHMEQSDKLFDNQGDNVNINATPIEKTAEMLDEDL